MPAHLQLGLQQQPRHAAGNRHDAPLQPRQRVAERLPARLKFEGVGASICAGARAVRAVRAAAALAQQQLEPQHGQHAAAAAAVILACCLAAAGLSLSCLCLQRHWRVQMRTKQTAQAAAAGRRLLQRREHVCQAAECHQAQRLGDVKVKQPDETWVGARVSDYEYGGFSRFDSCL